MRKCIAILLCLVGLAPVVGAACVVAKQDNKNSWVTHFEGGSNPGATSVSLSTNVGGTGLNVTAGGLIVIAAWCKPSCTVLSITKGAQTLANGQVQQTSVTGDVSAVGQFRIFYILSADTTGTQDISFVRSGTANDGTEHQIAAFSFTAPGCSWSHGIDTAVASNLGTLNANAPSITAPGTLLVTDTPMVGHTNTPGYGAPWAQTTWTPDNFSGLTNTSNGLSYMLPPSNVGTVANNVTEQSGTGPGWAGMLVSFIPSQNHYISSSGSDTNNGTSKATPWAHAPGMPNCTSVCNSYSVQPGDQFILKGGESWLAASLPVSWNGSGNSSNRVVVGGLDQTWFTGASWTRPVFDCQTTECGGAVVSVGSAAHYVTFDNIEIKNLKQITGSVKGMQTLSDNTTFSNNYIHAWSRSAGAADSGRSFGFAANTSNGEAAVANSLFTGNVVDGSDALNQDMFGGADDGQQVSNNVFRFVCNGIRGDHTIVSGNLVENVVNCFSGDHSNLIFVFGPFNGSTNLWMFNNVVRNLTASAQGSEVFWMNGNAGCASCTSYAYNNVIYNNGGGGSGRGIDIGGHPGNTYGTYNIFNNTIETTGGACMGNGEGGPRSTTNIRNNHCIASSTLCDGAGTTCNNQGNNLSQTLVQANGQGYNSGQVYAYSPTDVADSTVNAGGNLTASCTGNVAALCNDTIYPAYDAVNHVVVMRTVLPRPASGPWDEGAFELSSTPAPSVSFNPTSLNFASQLTGTSSASQSVVLTNSGSAALTITSITATGDFSQTNNCPGSLGVAATCTINVTFTPTASGARSGSISVADNAAGSPQTVALSGTGVTPTPTAALSAASISFSNQSVGTTSGSQTISLSNTGTATLAIASIVVNGDFARTTTCGATLGVGLSCNISVTFTPTVAGLRNGTLTVTDNSGGVAGSTQTASLLGAGISAFKTYALGRVSSGRSFAFGRAMNITFSYAARTDSCVTGAESGCIVGATTGKAGSPMSFRYRPGDANIFPANAPANTAATDPDFGSYMVLVTDQSIFNTCTPSGSCSFNMGSNGEYDAFNKDSTMLLIGKNGGATAIYSVNTIAIHANAAANLPTCSSCVVPTQIATGAVDCSSGTLGTGCTHLLQGGDWTFSRGSGESLVLYEEDPKLSKIYKLTINPSNWTFQREVYVDFASDLPTACKALPTNYLVGWSGVFAAGNDGSITKAYGGGTPWPPLVQNSETFIYPTVNNPGHRGFQLTTLGTLGSTEPTWNVTCNSVGDVCPDGTAAWTNIGNLFLQGPGFDIVNFRPGRGCSRLNTRTGRVTRGTGNTDPAGLLTTQDDSVCSRMTGTTCDPNGSTVVALTDRFTLHEAGQPFDSRYVAISPTGAGAVEAGTVAGSGSCSLPSANNRGNWSGITSYAKNDLVYLNQVSYVSNTTNTNKQPDLNLGGDWDLGDALCYSYVWQVASLVTNPCIEDGSQAGVGACGGHSDKGYGFFYKGTTLKSHAWDRPSRNGVANPGQIILPNPIGSADHHGSGRNEDSSDTLPFMFFTAEVPTSSARYDTAGYGEDIGLSPDGTQKTYRFNHNYNTGSSAEFGVQNAIGVISQDGKFAAMVSDWMGTRGSRVTGGTVCNKLRADDGPVKNASITTGFQILPVTNNTGQDIYQAQNNGTTDKTTTPNWNNSCPSINDVCTDGVTTPVDTAVRWKNLGPNDCRGDIAVIDLLSAHPLP